MERLQYRPTGRVVVYRERPTLYGIRFGRWVVRYPSGTKRNFWTWQWAKFEVDRFLMVRGAAPSSWPPVRLR